MRFREPIAGAYFFDQMHGEVRVKESKRFLVKHSSTKHLSTFINSEKNKQSTRTAYLKRIMGFLGSVASCLSDVVFCWFWY